MARLTWTQQAGAVNRQREKGLAAASQNGGRSRLYSRTAEHAFMQKYNTGSAGQHVPVWLAPHRACDACHRGTPCVRAVVASDPAAHAPAPAGRPPPASQEERRGGCGAAQGEPAQVTWPSESSLHLAAPKAVPERNRRGSAVALAAKWLGPRQQPLPDHKVTTMSTDTSRAECWHSQ